MAWQVKGIAVLRSLNIASDLNDVDVVSVTLTHMHILTVTHSQKDSVCYRKKQNRKREIFMPFSLAVAAVIPFISPGISL